MKNKIVITILILLPIFFDTDVSSYISYSLIIFLGILCAQKFKFPNRPFVNAIMLIILTSFLRIEQYSMDMFKDVCLMFIGIFPMLMCCHFKINIKHFNIGMILAFLLTAGVSLLQVRFSIESFVNSDIGVELGTFAYFFSLLAIYWVNKKTLWVIINFICAILCGKRIVALAIIPIIIFAYYLRNRNNYVPIKIKFLIFLFFSAYLFVSYLFIVGFFDDIFFEITGTSANAFTMGRQYLYSAVFDNMSNFNLWGLGPGNTVEILRQEERISDIRLHNDFLKIYSENGIFIYCAFFYLILKKIRMWQLPTLLMIFAIFMTTNSLVYAPHLLYYSIFLYADTFLFLPIAKKSKKSLDGTPLHQ